MGAPARQIVLDTETTGLEHSQGHRIIEIGCVEIINRRPTGRHFHKYLCPDRDIDEGALRVHGITREFLANQPRFKDVSAELLEFISGSELIIHNAPFDVGFLDAEFLRLDAKCRRITELCKVLDTLVLARQMHPGQRNGLDALCKRYFIDNSNRELHGALLDARLLADVYLAMTGGQVTLTLAAAVVSAAASAQARALRPKIDLPVVRATAQEVEAHEHSLALIDKASGGKCVWKALTVAATN